MHMREIKKYNWVMQLENEMVLFCDQNPNKSLGNVTETYQISRKDKFPKK